MCAGGHSAPILAISADKKILTIRGAVFDTVSQINTLDIVEEGFIQLDRNSERRQTRWNLRSKTYFESYIAFAEATYKFPDGQNREESLWRTLCCNLTSEIPVNRAPAEYAIGYKMLRSLHEITTPDGPFDKAAFETQIAWEDYAHYLALMTTMAKYLRGKNLCITDGGYLGSVPHGTLIGNRICILFGSTVLSYSGNAAKATLHLLGNSMCMELWMERP
jgi:hypothetical protein